MVNLYEDVSPDLLRTLANLTVTGRTLVDEQAPLRELLPAVRGTAERGDRLLDDNGDKLKPVA